MKLTHLHRGNAGIHRVRYTCKSENTNGFMVLSVQAGSRVGSLPVDAAREPKRHAVVQEPSEKAALVTIARVFRSARDEGIKRSRGVAYMLL